MLKAFLDWRRRRLRDQRPLRSVPAPLLLLLAVTLGLQLLTATQRSLPVIESRDELVAKPRPLPQPPDEITARALSLNEPASFSRALSLWLQNFDYQPGLSLPLATLDYPTVGRWLDLQLKLAPDNRYPLLAALHFYGSVADKTRARYMLEWVARAFRDDPAQRWRFMAEAAIKAKHKLRDLALAHRLARELDEQTRGLKIPGWARQLHIFLRADLGHYEEARALLGALIESGEVTRPEELRFLRRKLDELNDEMLKSRQ